MVSPVDNSTNNTLPRIHCNQNSLQIHSFSFMPSWLWFQNSDLSVLLKPKEDWQVFPENTRQVKSENDI